jgi:hypothetical protein
LRSLSAASTISATAPTVSVSAAAPTISAAAPTIMCDVHHPFEDDVLPLAALAVRMC